MGVWRRNIADPVTQSCMEPSPTLCKSMGMAYCNGGNNEYGMCVMTCDHCSIMSNDEYTIGGVDYEHWHYNNSGVCESTETARSNCISNSGYWCEALEECMENSCDNCKFSSGEEFTFTEESGSGFECTKRDCEPWESFCPTTMTCVGCNGDECHSNCDVCPGNPIETWAMEPAYASICAAPSESLCKEQWMDYCEAENTCKDRFSDSNTCRDCQGDTNWSPSSPGKCSTREEVVASCSARDQFYFKIDYSEAACTPACDQVYWEGMPLAANSSEAMCSLANVAGYTEHEVTVYANEYMDMGDDFSRFAGEMVPDMDGTMGEYDPFDQWESETTQSLDMLTTLEGEYAQYMSSYMTQGRRRRRLTMTRGKFERILPKKAVDDMYLVQGGPVQSSLTGETMGDLELYNLCAKTNNMAPECAEKAPPLPKDILTTTETRPGFFCSHFNTIVSDCTECDCDTTPVDIEGVMTCQAPVQMKPGCADPKALNYDRCAADSQPAMCDYDFTRFHVVPDMKLDTSMVFNPSQ